MIKNPTHLAGNLPILRKRKGYSQERVAEELGIKRNSYATYEYGYAEPTAHMLIRMSRYFDISINAMLETNLSAIESVTK